MSNQKKRISKIGNTRRNTEEKCITHIIVLFGIRIHNTQQREMTA